MHVTALAALVALGTQADATVVDRTPTAITPSAKVEQPASPAKIELIRRFLQLIGVQDQLDTGSFLERYAMPGGPMWPTVPEGYQTESPFDALKVRLDALKAAYSGRRKAYQQAYEAHLNWEFTEAELKDIVAFLGSPVGQHYLDGRWRMEAYTATNTEGMDEAIVNEAIASLKTVEHGSGSSR